jgi:hypothetical protein
MDTPENTRCRYAAKPVSVLVLYGTVHYSLAGVSVANLYTYVTIDGDGFDPDAFKAIAGGTIGQRYRMSDGRKLKDRRFWKSPVRRHLTVHTLDDALRGLLLSLKPAIAEASQPFTPRVCAAIVQEVSRVREMSGIFLSRETLGVLAGLGAELDHDIVRDLRRPSTRASG